MSATGRPEREYRSAQREGTEVNATPVSYYIYYRVADARMAVARQAVAALLSELERRTAVCGHLLHRQDEPTLWMEVYESVRDPVAFEAALEALLAAGGFASLLPAGGSRKTERFVAAHP
jgi:hypothetical protein